MALLRRADGHSIPLTGPTVTIGRDPTNDVVLDGDRQVSRRHAELQLRESQWLLVDLDSRNGSTVNGRAARSVPLVDGDRIGLGDTMLVYVAGVDPNATEARPHPAPAPVSVLSTREQQVVGLVAEGLSDREIATRLYISPSTVRSHLDRIGEKTGLRKRPELTRLAVELGLVGRGSGTERRGGAQPR